MEPPANKAMSPAPAPPSGAACRACGGKGTVPQKGQKPQQCIACRGTGKSGGDYLTK